ncbi:beta-lactamase [Hirsutella rhossiliensis]|uniref:Beta-lactamase domain-containing protein n=1 Tax=Hirsutella rhossiliensis TaxID=111463 RepID=A0A9P8N5V2_9HYPO|nr:beta-lactamase domain-containing protein [Hirsutella rhossiliensis]KAH0967500.1 beta-lactamase domain-containing protein [Hirsutella rhossiliensis]
MRSHVVAMLLPLGLNAFDLHAQVPLLGSNEGAPSRCPTVRQRLDNALARVEGIQHIGGTAGMSVGVMSHGQVLLQHSYGFADVETRAVANETTRYPLGSLTKAFVSATVAQLVHDGVLSWERPLSEYLPELSFQSDPALAGRLTLIDLLSHHTGLARLDALWLGANNEVVITNNSTIAVCNHLSSVYPLRSKWLYNNWMYALAGEVIERVVRKPWGQVLEERVLQRVGLSQTSVLGSRIPPDSTALPYIIADDAAPLRIGDLGLLQGHLMSSAGGVRSTVHDMLAWGNALLSAFRQGEPPVEQIGTMLSGQSFMNKSAVSDELYALGWGKVMTPAQFGKIGFNPGLVKGGMPVLGVGSEPQRVFYHNGGLPGYNHCIMLLPAQQAVIIVLTNSISRGDTADWAAQTLLQAVAGFTNPVDLAPVAKEAAKTWSTTYQRMAETLDKHRSPGTKQPPNQELVGQFRHTTGAVFLRVFEEGGALKFNINGSGEQIHVLSHYHKDTFIFLPSAEERTRRGLFHYATNAWLLHFMRDSDGKINHIVWNLDDQVPEGEHFVRH